MALSTAAVLYPVNSTIVDSGTGIDVRLLGSAQAGATDSSQSVQFTHLQDGQERTFDPETAAVTTAADPLTFQGEGYALRLAEDCTPTDDANCNAALNAGTLTVNLRALLNATGGTNTGGVNTITFRASLWRYNISTNAAVLIASGSQAQTWNTSALGAENNTRKNTAISIAKSGVTELLAGEVVLLQIGCEGTTLVDASLGTTNYDITLDVDDAATNLTWASGQGIRQICDTTGAASVLDGGAYTTAAKEYDGTNDYQTRGAELTGAADSKEGLISCWIHPDTVSSLLEYFSGVTTLGGGTARVQFSTTSTGQVRIFLVNGANTTVAAKSTPTSTVVTGAWQHILVAWNLATSTVQIAVADTIQTLSGIPNTPINDFVDLTLADWALGARANGTVKVDGCISEMFFHSAYLDISVEANRRKFISSDLKAVDLGANGSTPLGVQPLIYTKNGDLTTNLGSGGNFAQTGGTLTDCASAPPGASGGGGGILVSGITGLILPALGAAPASATVVGELAASKETTGNSAGIATATSLLSAVKESIGASAGVASVSGVPAVVVATTGTVNVSTGGGTTTYLGYSRSRVVNK